MRQPTRIQHTPADAAASPAVSAGVTHSVKENDVEKIVEMWAQYNLRFGATEYPEWWGDAEIEAAALRWYNER